MNDFIINKSIQKGDWYPDLHTHSTASDGALKPRDLIYRALNRGLNLLAITDHDTLAGISEAEQAANELNIHFIPGIELSAEGDQEVHILGYFIRSGFKVFEDLVNALQADRNDREIKYLDKLKKLGLSLRNDELIIPKDTYFSRPLLAKTMVNRKFVKSVQEAFDTYLSVGKPAYVPKLCIKAEEVIKTIRLANAIPVLAHPGLLRLNDSDLETSIKLWKAQGLMGIEVFHPSHTYAECLKFQDLANKHHLLITGGSDFHHPADHYHGELGQILSTWVEASKDVSKLMASSLQ